VTFAAIRQIRRDDGPQLDDRVAIATLDATRPYHDAGAVEGKVRGIEEEHLAWLGLDRVDRQPCDRGAVLLGRHRELQLDTVRILHRGEEGSELIGGDGWCR
jgi:hypothetical protein